MDDSAQRLICLIASCTRVVDQHGAKGMCPMHYRRSRAGTPIDKPISARQPAAGRICSIADCEKTVRARGLCSTHHQRWRVHGDPEAVFTAWHTRKTKVDHIWDFVDKSGPVPSLPWRAVPGNCWLWTGYRDSDGYGWLSGMPAHRRIYEIVIGSIPDGLTLDHLCRFHACVRPEHFEVVTRAENASRNHNRMKICCPAGHPYDDENTAIDRTGGRRCRACARERARERVRMLHVR